MGSCTITNKGTLKAGDGVSIDSNTISNTAGLYYTESVGTVSPTPINADQLEGHGSSYFQQTLVSGTNIKTINNSSLLGSGNITISRGTTLNEVYPVGAIYLSTVNTNPGTLFGGVWEQIKDTFLLTAGDTYTAGDTGGEATHTLTIDEIPSHQHTITVNTNGNPDGWNDSGRSYWSNQWGSSNPKTSLEGGGQAHNNMPPYLVVYAWRRVS